jgi:hypothetical protein
MDKKGRMLTVGGIFFLANGLMAGCDPSVDKGPQPSSSGRQGDWESDNAVMSRSTGVITEVQEVAPGQYRIVKEYPSNVTGVISQKLDGSLEVISPEKLNDLLQHSGESSPYGLGAVLAGGLVGYMMGKNTGLNQSVYANQDLYRQSLTNRELIDQRRKEQEQQYGGRSGYRGGINMNRPVGRPDPSGQTVGTRKTGFFSRFASHFHGLGS